MHSYACYWLQKFQWHNLVRKSRCTFGKSPQKNKYSKTFSTLNAHKKHWGFYFKSYWCTYKKINSYSFILKITSMTQRVVQRLMAQCILLTDMPKIMIVTHAFKLHKCAKIALLGSAVYSQLISRQPDRRSEVRPTCWHAAFHKNTVKMISLYMYIYIYIHTHTF